MERHRASLNGKKNGNATAKIRNDLDENDKKLGGQP